jgi:hypothetical protein
VRLQGQILARTATFVDVVPFLRASSPRASGYNPRSPDLTVARSCRDLLEDFTLEFTACGSRMVGGDASSDGVGSSIALIGKACFMLCTTVFLVGFYPSAIASACGQCWSVSGGARLLVALPVSMPV